MLDTSIEFLNVPFSLDGSHQYLPNRNQARSSQSQQAYFRQFSIRGGVVSNRVLIDPVDGSLLIRAKYQDISKANYMMFRNPSYGNKVFYAYVVDLVPRAGNETVEVYYIIDSMQSYLFEMWDGHTLSTVYREHSNPRSPKYADFTMGEELPTGKLEVARVISSPSNQADINRMRIRWAVFVATKDPKAAGLLDPQAGWETGRHAMQLTGKLNQTLYYYAVPFIASVDSMDQTKITVNGRETWNIKSLVEHFANNEAAVGSLVKVLIKHDLPIKNLTVSGGKPINVNIGRSTVISKNMYGGPRNLVYIDDRLDIYDDLGIVIAETSNLFYGINEPEYPRLMYPPFTRVYIESEDGAELEIDISKLNYGKGGNIPMQLRYRTNLGPVDNSILSVHGYNKKNSGIYNYENQYEAFLPFASSASVPVQTGQLASMLQSQENQIQAGKTQRAGQESISTSRGKKQQVVAVAGALVTIAAAAVGFAAAGPAGAAAAGAGTSAIIAASQIASSEAASAANAANAVIGGLGEVYEGSLNIKQAQKTREWGNLEVAARLNDAHNMPNTVGNTGADITYNMLNNRMRSSIKVKTVSSRYRDLAIDHFQRYGYVTNRLKYPNIDRRTAYNYIECDINIASAAIPQNHKLRIIEIFANGVTFWHNKDVYNYKQKNSWIAHGSLHD